MAGGLAVDTKLELLLDFYSHYYMYYNDNLNYYTFFKITTIPSHIYQIYNLHHVNHW